MKYDGVSMLTGCIISLVIGLVIGAEIVKGESVHQRELIERGLALYCPTDGRFAFKGECDESGR